MTDKPDYSAIHKAEGNMLAPILDGVAAAVSSDTRTTPTPLIAYQDPEHRGNSALYHTGKPCREKGCKEPAGTAWSPLWCFRHNVERIDRISASLDDFAEKARFSALADKVCADWHRTCGHLIRERDAILRAAGGKITVTKDQLEEARSHWGHQSHRDGSQTFQIDCGVGRLSHDALVEALRDLHATACILSRNTDPIPRMDAEASIRRAEAVLSGLKTEKQDD